MRSISEVLVLLFCLCLLGWGQEGEAARGQKLLIMMVDGFRFDYTDMDKSLNGFKRLERDGVKADYVIPVFPSVSYPNWYTIVTGLYPESHGMVGNYMYDGVRQSHFSMDNTPPLEFWWDQAEPLWTTAQKKGKNADVLWWDGCQIPHDGFLPRTCKAYRSPDNWRTMDQDTSEGIADVLRRFQRNETQLGLVYYEKVDHVGHLEGINSIKRTEAVRDVDNIISKVLDKIENMNLAEEVNLVVVSDHGMVDTNGFKLINFARSLNKDDIQTIVQEPTHVMIQPKQGRESKLYNDLMRANLDGVYVYNKETIPEVYHFKHNKRTLDILLVAKYGHYFQSKLQFELNQPEGSFILRKGMHGYDPYTTRDVRAIFYAKGPAFKKEFRNGPLEMVDEYNVFCHVLGLTPRPNNGSWSRVKDMLVRQTPESDRQQGDNGVTKNGFSSAMTAALILIQLIVVVQSRS